MFGAGYGLWELGSRVMNNESEESDSDTTQGNDNTQGVPEPSQGVPEPTVENEKLANLVKDLYEGARTENPIGTGSTADAIRDESETGEPVGGKFHTTKGEQYVNALTKWLRKKPDASESDRDSAQAMLDDLLDALE